MSAGAGLRSQRRQWVWVTRPEYYLDDDGGERRELDPGQGYEPGGWWTCHRDTAAGDLVVLYRSRRMKDLAYLIETRSAAYSLLDDEHAGDEGWDYGCDFEVIERFDHPLTLDEMRADAALGSWGALRAGFRRRVYGVPDGIWDRLMDRLTTSVRETQQRRRAARERYTHEREIEDHLAADLSCLEPFGHVLELRARQHLCRRGGRADLVCFDTAERRFVVIELKRGRAGRDAVGQLLSYRASVADDFPARKRPVCVLIAERLDNEAAGMIEDDARLQFVALASVGMRLN